MNALEREVRAFLDRHQVRSESRLTDRIEMTIKYTELDALEAALAATVRQVGPLPAWLYGRVPANQEAR